MQRRHAGAQPGNNFVKVFYIVTIHRKYTRTLTFQNVCQAALVMSQRSQLPLKIMDKLETLVNLVEMSRVTGVLMSGLIVHHQQYKVLSQLSRACKQQGFLIPGQKKSGAAAVAETSGKGFKGATVLDPQLGAHSSPICTLDFASLYPSIIMAHNLSYETLLRQNPREHALMAQDPSGSRCFDKLPYEKFSLDDEPTKVSGTASSLDQSYPGTTRFWKRGSLGRKEGILPSIVRRLLAARKQTKELLKRETDPELQRILHHRQLAYKVSCNAIYGYLGSNGTYALPCIPLAATITAIGRRLLQLTKDAVEDFFSVANGHHANASVIYGDTDSVMIDFKLDQAYSERQRTGHRCMAAACTSGGSRCWQIGEAMYLGRMAAKLVNASFLSSGWGPISLEFEKVYCPFLLFAKKHYAGLMYTDNPHQADKVDLKGMNTRNKCQFVEDTFNLCLHGLLHSDLSAAQVASQVQVARWQVDLLTSGKVPMDQLVLGTSLSRPVGEYKNKNEHVQLVVRMEERGTIYYKVGSRVLHVRVINKETTSSGVVEDPVVALKEGLDLDLLWYLEHQIKEPMKQLFSLVMPNCEAAIFGQPNPKLVTKRFDSHNAMMHRFLQPGRQQRCINCQQVLPAAPDLEATRGTGLRADQLCARCASEGEDLVMLAQTRLVEAQVEGARVLKTCLACTGESEAQHRVADMCGNSTCSTLYARRLSTVEVETCQKALEQISACVDARAQANRFRR